MNRRYTNYIGEWTNGCKGPTGVEWDEGIPGDNGKHVIYAGEFDMNSGKACGYGCNFTVDDDGIWCVYEGQFSDGDMHGQGLYISSSGNMLKGVFEKGEPQTGMWVRVDGDGYVESGLVEGGDCLPNP